ncbi:MAG: pyridoxamine 5'-phosphate oxidase family protein [Acidimicrobiia bacterium]|nr:pyridoxamine 5'-phosphate oxidase family protein [Acidimicrobiia bacterium]
MSSWKTFAAEAPELAGSVHARFAAHLHHVLATIRRDGAPRVSGTEVKVHDGDIWLGSMSGATKGADLRRDPRLALHSSPSDTDLDAGDARLDGRATLVEDPDTRARFAATLEDPGVMDGADLFLVDLDRATLVRVRGDVLHVDTWQPGRPVTHVERV